MHNKVVPIKDKMTNDLGRSNHQLVVFGSTNYHLVRLFGWNGHNFLLTSMIIAMHIFVETQQVFRSLSTYQLRKSNYLYLTGCMGICWVHQLIRFDLLVNVSKWIQTRSKSVPRVGVDQAGLLYKACGKQSLTAFVSKTITDGLLIC